MVRATLRGILGDALSPNYWKTLSRTMERYGDLLEV